MTVREQFRKMRAAQWEADHQNKVTDHWTATDLHTFAVMVIAGIPFPPVVSLGRMKICFSLEACEAWARERQQIDRIRLQLRQALWELDQEAYRREQLSKVDFS